MCDRENVIVKDVDGEQTSEKSVVPLELRSLDDFIPRDEWRNCPSPDSPRKHVKSTAVVKYSTVQSLANFAVLQCNTDLNSPPSNWLSSSADSYGLQHVPSHSTGFSSFRMAHMFPECVGEVDVVSDAENIKKLLKIPYSKGPVSMMVHRVENTLLIDEFDIHKYLLRTAESEWEWLKKFFFEHVLQSLNEKEKGFFHKNKSRCALQQKSLVSKFLYHSLAVAQAESEDRNEPLNPPTQDAAVPIPVPMADPPLPEPNLEEELPDPSSNHKFARNVVWTFEDIQMLIGTNLPIFGGKTHPCISLKLRDMTKPINVLTGIDYWLDNLMCNVPELVMCYHLDGIVQKYELIKTEDLPHLENSKFSPKVIRDVAQNILSFLKSNATKAGHTYWLFKGKDAEIVKLYDLTSLCSEMMDDKGQNPFTVPVAMLLYRVARNMKHSSDGQRQQGTIRLLLKNCISLLDKEKYPQIVTSAHYMLSDLYIPADTDPASPNLAEHLDEEGSPSEYDEAEEVEEHENEECEANFLNSSSSVEVKSLCVATSPPTMESAPPPPLSGDVKGRCCSALEHVAAGLQCLALFGINPEDSSEQCGTSFDRRDQNCKDPEPDGPSMAKPFEAIPMPYTPLKTQQEKEDRSRSPSKRLSVDSSKKRKREAVVSEQGHSVSEVQLSPRSLLCKYRAETMPTWQQPKPSDKVFWRAHLKILLHEKACLVYATLAESEYGQGHYGSALRYIGMVLRCQQNLEVLAQGTPNLGLQSYLLGRAGDLCFMIVQDWANINTLREEYNMHTGVDVDILREIDEDNSPSKNSYFLLDLVPQKIASMEQMLLASESCYKNALLLEPVEQQQNNLRRRLGNIENELGVLYMNQAAVCYQDREKQMQASSSSALQTLLNNSLQHLESGIQAFETVRDEANLALLLSNTGRLMRMCAHYHSPDANTRSELCGQERHFYQKALTNYQKAIQVLGNRKCNPIIWDTITWELSTTLFSMATILQDFPSLGNKSSEEAEREVVEFLLKALKYCDMETSGSRQLVYQFRAATIHHRLASLYHRSFRNLPAEESKRKNVLQLSRLHYEKASKLLLFLEHPSDYLRVQMERVALAEFQAQNAVSATARIKHLQGALELLCQCVPILKVVQERLSTAGTSGKQAQQESTSASKEHQSSELVRGVDKLQLKQDKLGLLDSTTTQGVNIATTDEESAEREEIETLLRLLEQRLQYVLLQLVKLHLGRCGQGKKEVETIGQLYKNLYSLSLRKGNATSGLGLADHLAIVLSQTDVATRQTLSGTKTR